MGLLIKKGFKITDSTAITSDCESGKIFYNNDGRQIGSGNIKGSYTFTISATTDNKDITYDCVAKTFSLINNVASLGTSSKPYPSTPHYYEKIILPKKPIGIIIDNVTYYFTITDNFVYIIDTNQNGNNYPNGLYFGIFIYKNMVFTGNRWIGKSITLIY